MSLPGELDANNAAASDAVACALDWDRSGHAVAIATVVDTWGSSPCPAGSMLVVDELGRFEGSVSGGCVESAVIEQAQRTLATGDSALLEFGVADETAWAVGLACGGRVRVLVRPLAAQREALGAVLASRTQRQPVLLVTPLAGGEGQLIRHPEELVGEVPIGAAREALRNDRTGPCETPEGTVLLQPFNPSPRVAIVGAVHIAQHLSALAQRMGYAVSVIDPRTAFASSERFPEVALSHEWPDHALETLGLDARTAVVALTHDPKLDDPALSLAAASPAFYVGALGSRKNHARRCERLRGRGVPEAAIARIHGPVGLDIGARSPAEIALSIAAQMTAALRT